MPGSRGTLRGPTTSARTFSNRPPPSRVFFSFSPRPPTLAQLTQGQAEQQREGSRGGHAGGSDPGCAPFSAGRWAAPVGSSRPSQATSCGQQSDDPGQEPSREGIYSLLSGRPERNPAAGLGMSQPDPPALASDTRSSSPGSARTSAARGAPPLLAPTTTTAAAAAPVAPGLRGTQAGERDGTKKQRRRPAAGGAIKVGMGPRKGRQASGGAAGSGSPSSASHGQGGGGGGGCSRSRRPRLGHPRSPASFRLQGAPGPTKVEACGPARLKGRGSPGPRGSPPRGLPEALSQLGWGRVSLLSK